MSITLTLTLTAGELIIDKYTTIDINRRDDDFNINLGNYNQDFAFNSIFEKIRGLQHDNEAFDITLKSEKEQMSAKNMTVDYHLNSGGEILSFRRFVEQPTQETQAQDNDNSAE